MPQGNFAADVIDAYGAGRAQAKQQRRDDVLSTYLPKALSGEQDAISAVAAVDPQLGFQAQGNRVQMDERTRLQGKERLGKLAGISRGLLGLTDDQQKWDGLRGAFEYLASIKMEPAQIKPLLDAADTNDWAKVEPILKNIIFTSDQADEFLKSPTDKRDYDLRARIGEANIRQSDASAARDRAAATNGGFQRAPAGYAWSPNGQLAYIPGGPADPNKIGTTEIKDVAASLRTFGQLESGLQQYRQALGDTSVMGRLSGPMGGRKISGLQSLHTNLLLQMKELYQLGVLNGPDYMLMTKMVEDPTSWTAAARGGGGLDEQLTIVEGIMTQAKQRIEQRATGGGMRLPEPAPASGVTQEFVPGGPPAGGPVAPPPAPAEPRMMLNGRVIVGRPGGWVYEDTGKPAQ